ncbi:unnamed protein product, partial [Ascophyllum nodosum]
MAKGDLTHGVASASKDPVGAGASRPSSADQGDLEINFATTISPPSSPLTPTPGRSNHRPTVRGESTVTEATLRQRRLRGSCDACTRRKRKCDGDGVRRCSLCVAKNEPLCHYSVRLPAGKKPQSSTKATVSSNNISSVKCIAPRKT